jgi:hypothetical protein
MPVTRPIGWNQCIRKETIFRKVFFRQKREAEYTILPGGNVICGIFKDYPGFKKQDEFGSMELQISYVCLILKLRSRAESFWNKQH